MADNPLQQLVRQAFESGDPAGLPLVFSREVLRKYKEAGAVLIRTKNAGRVMQVEPLMLRIDFGIHDESGTISVILGEFLHNIPRRERAHWAEHLVAPPQNERFLKMRLRSGCVDDGDPEPMVL